MEIEEKGIGCREKGEERAIELRAEEQEKMKVENRKLKVER